MCQVRARLLEAYENSEVVFSEALAEHCGQHGLIGIEQYQHLRDNVESAALALHGAKAALKEHQAAHGCSESVGVSIAVRSATQL